MPPRRSPAALAAEREAEERRQQQAQTMGQVMVMLLTVMQMLLQSQQEALQGHGHSVGRGHGVGRGRGVGCGRGVGRGRAVGKGRGRGIGRGVGVLPMYEDDDEKAETRDSEPDSEGDLGVDVHGLARPCHIRRQAALRAACCGFPPARLAQRAAW